MCPPRKAKVPGLAPKNSQGAKCDPLYLQFKFVSQYSQYSQYSPLHRAGRAWRKNNVHEDRQNQISTSTTKSTANPHAEIMSMRTESYACACVHARACVRVCMCACVCARMYVCRRSWVGTRMTWLHTTAMLLKTRARRDGHANVPMPQSHLFGALLSWQSLARYNSTPCKQT